MNITATAFLKTAEVKMRLRFETAEATTDFLRRHGAMPLRRGRELLWDAPQVQGIIERLRENTHLPIASVNNLADN